MRILNYKMETYFSKNICNIIRKKISVDYKKYKCWCYTEAKWIYFWSDKDEIENRCPNHIYHQIDNMKVVDIVKANGRILNIKHKIINGLIKTEFEIIRI